MSLCIKCESILNNNNYSEGFQVFCMNWQFIKRNKKNEKRELLYNMNTKLIM